MDCRREGGIEGGKDGLRQRRVKGRRDCGRECARD